MASITIWNVEHGDCVAISDICDKNGNDIVVVRDFGSKNGMIKSVINRNISVIAENVLIRPTRINDRRHEAILSHPHSDHSSGFKTMHDNKMYKFFEKAYIPWLDFSNNDTKHSKMLKVGLYFILYKDKSLLNKVRGWIEMAPIMYDLSKQLIGVSTHYQFNWSIGSEVIWPPFPVANDYPEIEDFEVLDELIQEFEQIGENDESVSRIYSEIRSHLNAVTSGERIVTVENADAETPVLTKINDLLDTLSILGRKKELSIAIRHNRSLYTNMIDDHSIVFSITNNTNNNSALFLSDLNEKPMEYMVNNFLTIKHYYLLKSAHHGTRMSNNLQQQVTADNIVHSCGLGQGNLRPLHSGYCQINNNRTIFCTSWNGNSPSWPQCPSPPYKVVGDMHFKL